MIATRTARVPWPRPAIRSRGILLAGVWLLTTSALAHHGKDFLLVETADMPHPRIVYALFTVDRVEEDEGVALEASPAVLVGVADRIAVELHVHGAREQGDRWRYEAVAPSVRFLLTPPGAGAWSAGASLEYEIVHGEEVGDRAEGRLIVMRRTGSSNLSANLIVERTREEEGGTSLGYALGFRPNVERKVGVGLEALGGFERHASHEILAGLYGEPNGQVTLKLGVGTGIGPDSPGLTARAGVVLRF